MINEDAEAGPAGEESSATLFRRPVLARRAAVTFLYRQLQFLLDLAVLAVAFSLAYRLRFDFNIPEVAREPLRLQLPFVVLIQFGALAAVGVYRFIWRYIGFSEMKAFLAAAAVSAFVQILLRMALPGSLAEWRVPRSVTVIDTVLAFGGVFALRVARRGFYERFERQFRSSITGGRERKRVLLVGAGRAGVVAAREILGRGELGLDIRGFVDDDPEKERRVIQGIRILGTSAELPELVRRYRIDQVILTFARASREEIRRIALICEQAPVKVRIIPGLGELLEGKVTVSRIRDVEIEDLLGRDPVRLEEQQVRDFLAGKSVMVTGAGGSIGSELARQILRFGPAEILLVERFEGALFEIDRELRAAGALCRVVPLLADVSDEGRMREILGLCRADVILHAAAHKHVPMMESNPREAVKNNVLATARLGRLAGELGVGAFVLISSDKAVRPASVMGATKRMAELAVQSLVGRYSTRYLAVRFGNVIGSAGSVVPIFQRQIALGGPVTVTDREMVRYFMTIPEAAQLVLQAGALGEGGEIFVLDMGAPIRILDLAKDLITLSGLRPWDDIDIVFTGRRPGEKIAEELQLGSECLENTRHPKIFVGRIDRIPAADVEEGLVALSRAAHAGSDSDVRRILGELIPEATLETG